MATYAEVMLRQQAEMDVMRNQFATEVREAMIASMIPGGVEWDAEAYNRAKPRLDEVMAKWYGRYRGDTEAVWWIAVVRWTAEAARAAVDEQATPEAIAATMAVMW